MNLLWDLYWPMITASVILGVIAGTLAFGIHGNRRIYLSFRHRRPPTLLVGAVTTLLVGWAWHAPTGTGDHFVETTERQARQTLVDFEMEPVHAIVKRDPIRRTIILSGPADDFQRSELVRILNELPGVANVRWVESPSAFTPPLLLEAELASLISFGVGLLLAYLIELRRRSNAQWSW